MIAPNVQNIFLHSFYTFYFAVINNSPPLLKNDSYIHTFFKKLIYVKTPKVTL